MAGVRGCYTDQFLCADYKGNYIAAGQYNENAFLGKGISFLDAPEDY